MASMPPFHAVPRLAKLPCMVAGEVHQQGGREGVRLARRWLDRTTRVKIQYDVYEWPNQVQLSPVAGPIKSFDLSGHLVDEDGKVGAPLVVEVKHCFTEGGQSAGYTRYLANCYSIVTQAKDSKMDRQWEFMWLTWHPFSLNTWTRLCEPAVIRKAVERHKGEVLDGREIDDELCRELAERMWLVVLGKRHEDLTMGKWLIAQVRRLQEEHAGS